MPNQTWAPSRAKAVQSSQEASGGERTRTADFYVANVALCQLSYTPGGCQASRGTQGNSRCNQIQLMARASPVSRESSDS